MLYLSDEDYEFVGREKGARIGRHGTGTVETRWKHKDGHIIDILLSSTPLHEDDLSMGVTFTALDITERKIVKPHGGSIRITSRPGEGTTSEIYLPASGEGPLEEKPIAKAPSRSKGTETILLVEDDDSVRRLAREMLRRHGYTVRETRGGPEALDPLASNDDPAHLLLADIVMLEMNGKELFVRAIEKHPDLKVLFMSGHTDDIIAHRGVLDEGPDFILKPFSVHALAEKVRGVLDQE